MDYKEIDALIRLLDDSDDDIFGQIRNRLVSYGKGVIPFLENAWGHSLDEIGRAHV